MLKLHECKNLFKTDLYCLVTVEKDVLNVIGIADKYRTKLSKIEVDNKKQYDGTVLCYIYFKTTRAKWGLILDELNLDKMYEVLSVAVVKYR